MGKIKFAVLKETKIPVDRRVALSPDAAKKFQEQFSDKMNLAIQSSDTRAFSDDEYKEKGLAVVSDVSDYDVLIGVKEVSIEKLISGKTYMFFSHTAKKQPYNRKLLQALVSKNIRMIDHEYLTDKNNIRLVAFGYWAGLVGAYNGLIAYGKKTGNYDLKAAHKCFDKNELFEELKKVKINEPIKILLTGGGRVAYGAMDTLNHLGIKKVTPQEYLKYDFKYPIYAQIDPWDYVKRKCGEPFDLQHFFEHPEIYVSTFHPYPKQTDMWIACHFWDPRSPVFLKPEDYKRDDFKISIIADVSCDIKKPIPSTIRASTIDNPLYGYDRFTGKEVEPFAPGAVTVMAVDNLPGELPRNASEDFGNTLVDKVLPSFFDKHNEDILERASITQEGKLTEHFAYLQDFLDGKE
ncbi:MAG TPA: alanine dehydrogenase [Bacteroidales bacterium]|nr:alanine dehydrogenase [Bacteroidales bacterium]